MGVVASRVWNWKRIKQMEMELVGGGAFERSSYTEDKNESSAARLGRKLAKKHFESKRGKVDIAKKTNASLKRSISSKLKAADRYHYKPEDLDSEITCMSLLLQVEADDVELADLIQKYMDIKFWS